LIERNGKGFTPWKEGPPDDAIAIEHWGFRRPKWCMKNQPKDWEPLPEVYRKAREEEQTAALERFRVKQAEHRQAHQTL